MTLRDAVLFLRERAHHADHFIFREESPQCQIWLRGDDSLRVRVHGVPQTFSFHPDAIDLIAGDWKVEKRS